MDFVFILPNNKLLYYNNNLYQSNLLKLLTQSDYNTLNSSISSLQSTVNNVQNNSYSDSNKPYVTGYYLGNDEKSRTISLGFQPDCVLILSNGVSVLNGANTYGGLALKNRSAAYAGNTAISIITNGFMIRNNTAKYVYVNSNSAYYHYIAFK